MPRPEDSADSLLSLAWASRLPSHQSLWTSTLDYSVASTVTLAWARLHHGTQESDDPPPVWPTLGEAEVEPGKETKPR